MIRVMVVDDSPTALDFLTQVLSQEPGILVVGIAHNGEEALRIVGRVKPDLITMDVDMPGMDSLEATRRIMESHPAPIIILSKTADTDQVQTSFKAMEAGAVAVIERPPGADHPNSARIAGELVQMIVAMSKVATAKFRSASKEGGAESSVDRNILCSSGNPGYPDSSGNPGYPDSSGNPGYPDSSGNPGYPDSSGNPGYPDSSGNPGYPDSSSNPGYPDSNQGYPPKKIRLIAIGASTGGPVAIQALLQSLSKNIPAVPILVVQHIVPDFIEGMAAWLSASTGFPVHVATDNILPQAGHVYLAPDSCHMGLSCGGYVHLTKSPPERGVRPAISYFFRSVASTLSSEVVAILLTGMGTDGAEELKLLKNCGAITVAQDSESSAIFGMPAEAIRLEAATHVLPPKKIAELLIRMFAREKEYDQ